MGQGRCTAVGSRLIQQQFNTPNANVMELWLSLALVANLYCRQ
jgi:hypothetical protein